MGGVGIGVFGHVPSVAVELPDQPRVGLKSVGSSKGGGIMRSPKATGTAEGG